MKNKLWRTLIRVIQIEGNNIWIIVPTWNYFFAIAIQQEEIPFNVEVGQRLHAKCNLGEENISSLYFEDWEKND